MLYFVTLLNLLQTLFCRFLRIFYTHYDVFYIFHSTLSASVSFLALLYLLAKSVHDYFTEFEVVKTDILAFSSQKVFNILPYLVMFALGFLQISFILLRKLSGGIFVSFFMYPKYLGSWLACRGCLISNQMNGWGYVCEYVALTDLFIYWMWVLEEKILALRSWNNGILS